MTNASDNPTGKSAPSDNAQAFGQHSSASSPASSNSGFHQQNAGDVPSYMRGNAASMPQDKKSFAPLSPFEMAAASKGERANDAPPRSGIGAAVNAAHSAPSSPIAVDPDGTAELSASATMTDSSSEANAWPDHFTASDKLHDRSYGFTPPPIPGFGAPPPADIPPKPGSDEDDAEQVSFAAKLRKNDPWALPDSSVPRSSRPQDPLPDDLPWQMSDEADSLAASRAKSSQKGGLFSKKASAPPPPKSKPAPKAKAPPKPKGPKPVYPPFEKTHPILGVEQTLPPSIGSRMFNALAVSPFIFLTVLYLIQTLFTLDARALWFSDEIRHASVFQNLLYQGKGLILELNGQVYPDKPPLYFWFLRGLYELVRTDGPMLHFTAAAISGLLYLWAALGLGSTAARVDRKTNLAAGLILLSTGYIMGTFHYGRMDLLFSALIIASHIALYRALVSPENSFPGMVLGFVLAGVATLVKGPLGLGLPLASVLLFAVWRGSRDQARMVLISLLSAICGLVMAFWGSDLLLLFAQLSGMQPLPAELSPVCLAPAALVLLLLAQFLKPLRICCFLSIVLMAACFVVAGGTPEFSLPLVYALPASLAGLVLLWQACPQRLFRLDFFVGLIAGLLVAGSWFGIIYTETGNLDFIVKQVLDEQILQRAADTFHHKESWYYYLTRLPLMFLPWTLLVIFLPWRAFGGNSMRNAVAATRTPEKEGIGFLWCMVVSALLLLSALSGKILIYFLPVAPAVAIIAARAILGLTAHRATLFRYSMALFIFIFGLLVILAALVLFGVLPMPEIKGLPHWILPTDGGFFVVGSLLLVAGATLWFALGSSRPEGVLLVTAFFATALAYPLAGLVAPTLDPVMSPKNQALLMRAYVQQGYAPASFKDYPGTYTFYSGYTVPRIKSLEDASALAQAGKTILAIRASELDAWQEKPECLTEVHRQWIESRQFALLACPPIPDLAPADLPYTPAPDIFGPILKELGIEWPPAFLKRTTPIEPTPSVPALPEQRPVTPEQTPVEEAAPADPSVPDAPSLEETPLSDDPSVPAEVPAEEAPAADTPAEDSAPEQTPADVTEEDATPEETAPADAPAEAPEQAPAPEDATPSGDAPAAPPADPETPLESPAPEDSDTPEETPSDLPDTTSDAPAETLESDTPEQPIATDDDTAATETPLAGDEDAPQETTPTADETEEQNAPDESEDMSVSPEEAPQN